MQCVVYMWFSMSKGRNHKVGFSFSIVLFFFSGLLSLVQFVLID